ncbi:MAG TPA: site-specific integrase [Ilumatobacteraceae bacterium]
MPTQSLTDEQIARLLAVTSDRRTALLIRLLFLEGFGLGEILALDHEQIVGSRNGLSAQLVRRGRTESISLSPQTCAAVAALQRSSGTTGPLLAAAQPAGAGHRITRFGADYLIKQAAIAAEVGETVSANVLRRSHAASAQRRGVHVLDTRDRMGHSDVRTTHRHLSDEPLTNR